MITTHTNTGEVGPRPHQLGGLEGSVDVTHVPVIGVKCTDGLEVGSVLLSCYELAFRVGDMLR